MPDFFAAFEHLATENEKVGELIEKEVVAKRDAATRTAEQATRITLIAAAVALAVFILIAVVIVRSIENPLRACPDGQVESAQSLFLYLSSQLEYRHHYYPDHDRALALQENK